MTTDTFPKLATRQAKIGDATVTINGICKGSGMIAPDMATMLAFVATDAKIPAADPAGRCCARRRPLVQLHHRRRRHLDQRHAAAGGDRPGPKHPKPKSAGDPVLKDFRAALEDLLIDLAVQVVRDGEGAAKLVTIDVTGAATARRARRIGLAIANSPLVKTAIAGEDANWGRIVMAVGKSGEKADRDKLEHQHRRRHHRREGPARARTMTRRRSPPISRAATSASPSMSASARARRGSGPAT